MNHGLRTPVEEIAFTAWSKIHSHSQIFRYGRSIFWLPHRPKFSDFFDLCLHWVSVVRDHELEVDYFLVTVYYHTNKPATLNSIPEFFHHIFKGFGYVVNILIGLIIVFLYGG